ncbi:hypothetical protein SIM91_04820 [Rhodococcus opacus]|uniref:hypothetical protein n=1 Tax=Rhodococcus opacus TaxID=37919 RepID=UPI0002A42E82|nr:hypothetical protein [Rhodococcus opacus]ELB88914.1 hypothetical protein Rwratislav_32160 [Rhodococcus wratislaviensis IFP 2016]MDX5962645.1 hypothetical protein [Rhodococcus opacus]CAG7636037.1 hypothetical protein E143388_07749 [Rhodococcus opacus]
MSNAESVFEMAATRLRSVAGRATPGPYLRSNAVPGALRCVDAPDGGEQHLAFGIARKEDFRLLVGADPGMFELLAAVFAAASGTDAAAPELAELSAYLSQKMGLKLPPVKFSPDDRVDELPELPVAVAPVVASERTPAPPPQPSRGTAVTRPTAHVPALDAADL